jgi:hypothetical protein
MKWSHTKNILVKHLINKVFCLTGAFIPGTLFLVLGFLSRESTTVAVILLVLACAVGGASSSGSLPNIVDLSPNFAGRSTATCSLHAVHL